MNPKTWQRISHYSANAHWHSEGWLAEEHSECLRLAYPGFCNLWAKERWQVPITQAVSWLVQAAKSQHNLEGAIAFCQIPLEMLAWLVFVDTEAVVDSDGFDKLSASNKFQLLLHHCRIPLSIPDKLDALLAIAEVSKKSGMTGPQVITEIRNTIVRPNERNRQKLEGWMTIKKLDREQVLSQTLQLFRQYITLMLLSFMDYDGLYADRLILRMPSSMARVPWAD